MATLLYERLKNGLSGKCGVAASDVDPTFAMSSASPLEGECLDEQARDTLIYNLEFIGILVFVLVLQYYYYRQRKAKQEFEQADAQSLFSMLFTNYVVWWLSANVYQTFISAGHKEDPLYWIVLFPENFTQHMTVVLLCSMQDGQCQPTHSGDWMRRSALLSVILFFVAFSALILAHSVFDFADGDVTPYKFFVLGWIITAFALLQIGYYRYYSVLKAAAKWDSYARAIFVSALVGIDISFTVSFVGRIVTHASWAWWVMGLFDLHFFYSFGLLHHYIDSQNIGELSLRFLCAKPRGAAAEREHKLKPAVMVSEQFDVLPSECGLCNALLNVVRGVLSTVWFVAQLLAYALCIVVPLLVWWLLNAVLLTHLWNGVDFLGFAAFYLKFLTQQTEFLCLCAHHERGVFWKVWYGVITFGDGLTAMYAEAPKADAARKKVELYAHRLKLSDSAPGICEKEKDSSIPLFGADGALVCADYDYALAHYCDEKQMHEFAGRYHMNPIIANMCPFYSLGQNAGTKTWRFIHTANAQIASRALRQFGVGSSSSAKLKAPDTKKGAPIKAEEAFAFALSAFHSKALGAEMADEDKTFFRNNFVGSLCLILPNSLTNVVANQMIPRKLLAMIAKLRQCIVKQQRRKDVEDGDKVALIIKKCAEQHELYGDDEEAALNSFCMETIAGVAGIGSVFAFAMEQIAKDEARRTEQFAKNPEKFVMEALRMAGFPSAGRTVLGQTSQCPLRVGGNRCVLQKGQAVVHDFIEMNRAQRKFEEPNKFDCSRQNLLADVFIFGNTERNIRKHSQDVHRVCPFRKFAILQIQELIAIAIGTPAMTLTCDGEEKQYSPPKAAAALHG